MSAVPPQYHAAVRVEREGLVATVTLDRPESKNACTGEMWVALGRTFKELDHSGVRAIVLTGAGGNFCSGADLAGAGTGTGTGAAAGSGGGEDGAVAPHNLENMRVLADVVLAVHDCSVPVVAKVEGLCVGAGLGLALAADLTYCADDARLSLIFAKRGLSLDFGTSWLLRDRIGTHRAKELAYTARMLSGAEAAALGLVNAAVSRDELGAVVADVASTIAGGPPLALSMTKRLLDASSGGSLATALEQEGLAQTVNVGTDDMKEAFLAYFEKRPPTFEGR
jgi:2-(1,2-epoxy-1,2-dihydrophenyl)acetyl-CoA isomerase